MATWTRRRPPLWLGLAVALSQSACSILSNAAVSQFSAQSSCPKDRLAVQSVGVRPQDVFVPAIPPADIAADPGRLAVWTRNVKRELAQYRHLTVVEVAGCDAHRTYFCWEAQQIDQDGYRAFCDVVSLENPEAKLELTRISPSARLSLLQRLHPGGVKPGS